MKLFILALPVAGNDGEPLDVWIEHYVYEACQLFGGVTLGPEHDGHWIDPATGRYYRDRMRPMRVIAFSVAREDVLAMARRAARSMGQECIHVEELDVIQHLVKP